LFISSFNTGFLEILLERHLKAKCPKVVERAGGGIGISISF
jgi:hypothetical protein